MTALAAPPVQRPVGSRPTLPDAPPPVSDPSEDPSPPSLPPVEPPPASDPFVVAPAEPPAPPRSEALPPASAQATDDELAPIADGKEAPLRNSDRLLRPTDHRRFFSLSAGGATSSSPIASYYGGSGMDFQAELAVGSHSKRRPTLGGAFIFQYRKGFATEVTLGGRVQWDKPLSKAFALYSATDISLGLNIPLGYGGYFYPSVPNAIVSLGWGLKAVLANRLLLFFKPVGPGLVAPAYSQIFIKFRWEVGGGIGIVW